MFELYILRHGQAEGGRDNDAERALTETGEAEAGVAGLHLLKDLTYSSSYLGAHSNITVGTSVSVGSEPGDILVVSSPYKRAKQTAQIVCDVIGRESSIRMMDELTPDTKPTVAVEAIGNLRNSSGAENMLIVSHLPLVGMLIGILSEGVFRETIAMGTAYLTKLEIKGEHLGLGTANHLWTKQPSQPTD